MRISFKTISYALWLASIFAFPMALRADETKPPPGWIRLNIGDAFSFRAPPGTKYLKERGEDSFVGRIVGKGFTLEFDFGLWSNDLGYEERGRKIIIDGRDAYVITEDTFCHQFHGQHGLYFVGLHIPFVSVNYRMGSTLGHPRDKLSIYGCVLTAKDEATVEHIFSTIHFPPNL